MASPSQPPPPTGQLAQAPAPAAALPGSTTPKTSQPSAAPAPAPTNKDSTPAPAAAPPAPAATGGPASAAIATAAAAAPAGAAPPAAAAASTAAAAAAAANQQNYRPLNVRWVSLPAAQRIHAFSTVADSLSSVQLAATRSLISTRSRCVVGLFSPALAHSARQPPKVRLCLSSSGPSSDATLNPPVPLATGSHAPNDGQESGDGVGWLV